MRKNLYALAIAGILAVSTMAPTMVSAAATGTPDPQTHETPVSYKYKDPSLTFDGFTVTVPAALDMTSDIEADVDSVTVKMEQTRSLPTGKSIFVDVASKNGYKLYKAETGTADGNNDPTYELKTVKQDTQPGNFNAGTLLTGVVTSVGEFKSTDFGDTSQNAVEKKAWLEAKIKTKPQVGLDNQKFIDTLTFTVKVAASTGAGA